MGKNSSPVKRLIPIYDRGGSLMGWAMPAQAQCYAELPGAEVVRNRAGKIKQVRLHAPGAEDPVHGFPSHADLKKRPGQRYSYLEQIRVDAPTRVYALRSSRLLPQAMANEVVRSVGADLRLREKGK